METKETSYYQALYRVARTINSTLDPREVPRSIAQSVSEGMGAKACSLMLLSPDHRELYHTAAHGLSDWYVRKGPLDVDLSMKEALSGHASTVLHAGSDPRVQYREQAIKEGISSVLSVPIRLRDAVIGVMRVYTAEPREFDAADIEFVEAAANLGAIALENARRFDEVKSHYDAVRHDLLDWYATWGLERSADALSGEVFE